MKPIVEEPMEAVDVLPILKKAGLQEVYHRMTFEAFRTTRSGSMQEIVIELLDAGPDSPSGVRYACTATTADGRSCGGNGGSTIEEAILTMHWYHLDE